MLKNAESSLDKDSSTIKSDSNSTSNFKLNPTLSAQQNLLLWGMQSSQYKYHEKKYTVALIPGTGNVKHMRENLKLVGTVSESDHRIHPALRPETVTGSDTVTDGTLMMLGSSTDGSKVHFEEWPEWA